MTNRLDFITGDKTPCRKKKEKEPPKKKKQLLKDLERARFKAAKLEFENMELRHDKDKLLRKLEEGDDYE